MLWSQAGFKMADDLSEEEPPNSEKKDDKFLGFALYSYNANRPNNSADVATQNEAQGEGISDSAVASTSVADFLRKEATSNHDFSLSVLSSNLAGEQETELRTFIAKRLARGTVYSGSGNIAELDAGTVTSIPCQCYYCLLRGDKKDGWTNHEPRDPSGSESSYLSKDYVICYVCSGEHGLELFQDELDEYSTNLLPHLEKSSESLDMQAEFRFLESWYEDIAQFLCRCTEYFKEDVSVLIHCGLVGTRLNVTSSDLRIQKDIKMFVEACSIVKLLNSLSDSTQSGRKVIKQAGTSIPKAMSVKIHGSSYGFSTSVTTQFCKEWSKTMLSGDVKNAVFLRQVIENYKLKVIQDMNTLKRLLRRAETDHYALYRSYIFLLRCGNGTVLLRNTKLEALTLNSSDTLNIIKALEDHIEETGIFDSDSTAQDSIS